MAREPLRDDEIDKFRSLMQPREPKLKDSVKQMMDDGFGVVTGAGQTALETIKDRYTGNFRTFFTELRKHYDKTRRMTAEITRVTGVMNKINTLVSLIDKISATPDILKAREYGLELLRLAQALDEDFVFFTDATKISGVLSANFVAVANKTGIPLEDLSNAQAIFTKKTKEIAKPKSLGSKIEDKIRTIGEVVGRVGSVDMMGGGQSIRDNLSKQQIKKERLEANEWNVAGTNIGTDTESGGVEQEDESIMGAMNRASGASGGGGGDIESGLFAFFNGRAMKAKWTKRMLDSSGGLGGLGSEDSGGGAGGFGGRGLTGLIQGIVGPVIAVMGAGMVGWMAGRAIGGLEVGGKTIDKHIEGAGVSLMGGDEDARMKKAAKKARKDAKKGKVQSTMARAMQLQVENPGMTSKEAAQIAWAEEHPESTKAKETLKDAAAPDSEIDDIKETIGEDGWRKLEMKSEDEMGAGGEPNWLDTAEGKNAGDLATTKWKMNRKGIDNRVGDNELSPEDALTRSGAMGEYNQRSMARENAESYGIDFDVSGSQSAKEQADAIKKLNDTIDAMNESFKSGGGSGGSKSAGYDANNIRNPVMSSLGAGQLTN